MSLEESRKKTRINISEKKKIAFVCSGGAAKAGAYHLGVALALQEKGFKFIGGLREAESGELKAKSSDGKKEISIYVGSSAGSIICSYLASGYTLEQIFDSFLGKKDPLVAEGKSLKRLTYTTMFTLRKETSLLSAIETLSGGFKIPTLGRFVGTLAKDSYENLFRLKWLKLPGLFSTSGIEKYLREDVLPSNHFQSYAADLFIVATQLNHSRKIVFGKYKNLKTDEDKTVAYRDYAKISDACAASTALPIIFSPYPIENESGHKIYYFDGEIRDTLSTHVAFDAGADLIIASYTHQPYHFVKEIGSLHQFGMSSIMIQALYLLIERKIQNSMKSHHFSEVVLDTVSDFFKENHLPDDKRKQLLEKIEAKISHRRGVDYIYINPKASEHQMFFGDHFNLSASKMSDIVKIGFRSAIDVLRRHNV